MLRELQPVKKLYCRCIAANNWWKSPICSRMWCFWGRDFSDILSKWPTDCLHVKISEQEWASFHRSGKESHCNLRSGKWHHLLAGRHFTIVTHQNSVSFVLDNRKRTKVKNNKIQCWRLELRSFSYGIQYRPGRENNASDALTRASCSAVPVCNLGMLHRDLCDAGVTRMLHFVRWTYLSQPRTWQQFARRTVFALN